MGRRRRLGWCALLCAAALASPAQGDRREVPPFSDGPRWVARPRGASLARARRLGLGTRKAASRLLRARPPAGWVRAAGPPPRRLLWPVASGRYIRGFGYVRKHRPELIHNGVDIGAPEGSVVRAAAAGIVAYSDNGIRGFGNCVLIVHGNGWVTLYAHNQRTTVQPGWRVTRGERIALVGSTGISRMPHLHFELRRAGRAVDPLSLFDGGPAFVRRVAARAGGAPTPHGSNHGSNEGAAPRTSAPDARPPRRALRDLLRRGPTQAEVEAAGERHFRTLLWPARGGRPGRFRRGRLPIRAPAGTPVRAAADGRVVFVGARPGLGKTVVLVHPMGWLTAYGGLGRIDVAVGQAVRRGNWIARVSGGGSQPGFAFELRIGARARDPRTRLVGRPPG